MKRRHPFGGAYAFVGLFTSGSYNQMPHQAKLDHETYNRVLKYLSVDKRPAVDSAKPIFFQCFVMSPCTVPLVSFKTI